MSPQEKNITLLVTLLSANLIFFRFSTVPLPCILRKSYSHSPLYSFEVCAALFGWLFILVNIVFSININPAPLSPYVGRKFNGVVEVSCPCRIGAQVFPHINAKSVSALILEFLIYILTKLY